jgi:hypothetical protein
MKYAQKWDDSIYEKLQQLVSMPTEIHDDSGHFSHADTMEFNRCK